MKNGALLSFVLFFFVTCTVDDQLEHLSKEDTYQLWFSYSPEADRWLKQNVITYFKDVALGSEYGDHLQITRKWKSDMNIFVGGDPEEALRTELESIVEEINSLSTDDFSIKIIDDSLQSNFYVFFGESEAYARSYPQVSTLVNDNHGLFSIFWNSKFEITSGHMYVDTKKVNRKIQKHILREELTQSLGLANDIPYYPNSIFYKDWSDSNSYSNYDIEIIRLLYHPKMRSGLSAGSVENILSNILGI